MTDAELCIAIRQVMLGQADDLGGGVFKKRLGKNLYRSIVLTKTKTFWVYTYLFAKKDKANISGTELAQFRDLADLYARKSEAELTRDIEQNVLTEICHERTTSL